MKRSTANCNKENRHPNCEVMEEDISKIAQSYVFDGQRVKAKSIVYREPSPCFSTLPKQTPIAPVFTQEDFNKLQHLQKMGVLTAAEQKTLQQLRKMTTFGRKAAREPLLNPVQEQESHYAPQNNAHFQFSEHYESDCQQNEECWEGEYEPSYQQNYSGFENERFQQGANSPYQQSFIRNQQF